MNQFEKSLYDTNDACMKMIRGGNIQKYRINYTDQSR